MNDMQQQQDKTQYRQKEAKSCRKNDRTRKNKT